MGPTQPTIQWVSGTLSLGVKWPVREAEHSPPSSAQVKNSWSYASTPQYVFMAWCLVKHRDNFTFLTLPHPKANLEAKIRLFTHLFVLPAQILVLDDLTTLFQL
jgi:hypothetical protein